MMRWIASFTTLALLSGCVYTQEVVYREPYQQAPYYQDGYSASPEYRQDDVYHAPSRYGYGDYYGSSSSNYYGGSYYGGSYGVSYFDYPFYYSVFWPINRWYYDPFAYPGYYYGVTWFPRNYFSLNLTYRGGWYGYSWLSYSPYRYSWVDSYYDWGYWYHRYPSYRNYYPTPRYGDARVEASRLNELRRPGLPRAGSSGYYSQGQRVRSGAEAPAYRANRAPDYGRAGAVQRQSAASEGVRRVNAGNSRVGPTTGLFGNALPPEVGNTRPGLPRGSAAGSTPDTVPRSASQSEIQRLSGQRQPTVRANSSSPGVIERGQQDRRGFDVPGNRITPRSSTTEAANPPRRIGSSDFPSRPAQPIRTVPDRSVGEVRPMPRAVAPVRGGDVRAPAANRPIGRGYSTGPSNSVPVRQPQSGTRTESSHGYVPPATPVRSVPVPQVAEPPASSSRSSSDSRSSSSSASGVRRVGSGRER